MEALDVIIKLLLGVLGIFISFSLASFRKSVEHLQTTDEKLERRVNGIEVKLGEKYVTRQEVADGNKEMRNDIRAMRNEIVDKLNSIEGHVQGRIDRLAETKANK